MSKKILGIGNAIVDVFVKVDDNFLSKNKLIKGSMKLIEKDEFEILKSTINIEKIEAGGSVANTMAGISYLEGNSSFIGKINSDEFGRIYKKSLEKIKVNFPYSEKTENLSTGASIIFISLILRELCVLILVSHLNFRRMILTKIILKTMNLFS